MKETEKKWYRDRVRGSFLFRCLPDEVGERLFPLSTFVCFKRGGMIFQQGDTADSLFVVADGWIKLFRLSQGGHESIVNLFTRGQSFGEAAAMHGHDYPVSAEAATNCVLMRVPAAPVRSIMLEDPKVCLSVIAAVFQHHHELVGQIDELKSRSGPQRVAAFLLDLARFEGDACIVTLPYNKHLIAGRLGMTPESLSRALGRLRRLGLKIDKNQVAIADKEALRAFVEDGAGASCSDPPSAVRGRGRIA